MSNINPSSKSAVEVACLKVSKLIYQQDFTECLRDFDSNTLFIYLLIYCLFSKIKKSKHYQLIKNDPSHQNTSTSPKLWLYYYSCGSNKSYSSSNCTSKYKYAIYNKSTIFKDTKGSRKNFKHCEVKKLL